MQDGYSLHPYFVMRIVENKVCVGLISYAKVKYNSPDALSTIVNNAFNNMYAKAE